MLRRPFPPIENEINEIKSFFFCKVPQPPLLRATDSPGRSLSLWSPGKSFDPASIAAHSGASGGLGRRDSFCRRMTQIYFEPRDTRWSIYIPPTQKATAPRLVAAKLLWSNSRLIAVVRSVTCHSATSPTSDGLNYYNTTSRRHGEDRNNTSGVLDETT